jgi:S-layer protein
VSSTLSGGLGTDTLVMAADDAATVSQNALFEAQIDGFEKLSLGKASSSVSVNLANMDGISHVISAGGSGAQSVMLNSGFSGGGNSSTIQFTASMPAGATLTIYGLTISTSVILSPADYVSVLTGTNIAGVTMTGALTQGVTLAVNSNNSNFLNVTGAPGDFFSAVAPAAALTLTDMANGGTLELTDTADTTTVTMTNATGTADSFNIITKVGTADRDFGTVDVQDVETVNITATDTDTKAAINLATLELVGDAKTVVLTGNGHLDLTAAISALKTVDASALTGDFTFSSAVNSATVTGGAGDDLITGTGNSQILTGGLGDDTLVVTGNLARLTGGAGKDVFNVGDATTTVNSYATITDLAAGDAIKLSAAALEFVSSAVTLADTAVFQDYADAAIAATGDGEVSWFQFAGNTYVVENVAIGQTSPNDEVTFTNGQDIVVRITGLVDLSTSAFSSTQNALLVV